MQDAGFTLMIFSRIPHFHSKRNEMKRRIITVFFVLSILTAHAEPSLQSKKHHSYFVESRHTEELLPRTGSRFLSTNHNCQVHGEKKEEVEAIMYKQEEVTFRNADVNLAGTLTIPKKSGRHPAVILLPGSGPVNRDEEAFGWKPFRIISDYFTQNGIAVLRYDSRGVGGSTGDVYQSTFNDFAGDAIAAIHYLKRRKDINPDQIGLCGHSQGGIVAPIVASRSNDVAFIICVAGAGITGEECFITQFGMIDRLDGATDEDIEKLTDMRKQLFNLIRKDASETEIKPLLMKIAQTQTEIQEINEDKKREETQESLEEKLSCMLTLFNSPWGRFFLDYNPQAALEKIKCPVLLIFGEMDMQVLLEENKGAMVSALMKSRNSDFTVKTFPKANHLFQMAKSGHPSEYTELPKKFVPGFLEFMSDWILQHVYQVR